MSSRFAIVLAIAAVLVGALVYSGCGGDDDDSSSTTGTTANAAKSKRAPGEAVDHAERAAAPGGHGGGRSRRSPRRPASRSTSRSWTGACSSTASATRRSPARARTSRRPAPRRCRSSPRSAGSRTCAAASRTSAARRLPRRRVADHPGGRPGRHLVGPVVHGGALDLLPQGRPREGRRRSGDRLRETGTLPRHAEAIKEKVPGHPAVRHARQEGVRPRPPRDAVRVGRRRRRAVGGQQRVDDQLARGGARASTFFADLVKDGLADPSPARARRHAGREPVQGRQDRRLDRWSVGARLDPARRRHQLGPRRRARTSASPRCPPARTATRTRSSAART